MQDDLNFENEESDHSHGGQDMEGAAKYRQARRRFTQAMRIQVSPRTDGTFSVSVDDLRPFSVSRVSATLLQVLAMEEGSEVAICRDDPFVPFKTVDDLLLHMSKSLQREFTQAALKQALHRLRKTLSCYGYDGLLQTRRQMRAYRLAVRRKQ